MRMKMVETSGSSWQFLRQFLRNLFLANDLAILLPGLYPKEMKTYAYTKSYIWICTIALSIITKNWKKLKCPQWVNGLKKKLVHSYNGILLSHEKNKLLMHVITWWISNILYTKWRKPVSKGYILYDFIYYYVTSWKRQMVVIGNRSVVTRSYG